MGLDMMHGFRKILFIADGSKGEASALAKVMELAESNGASLSLMDVVEEYPDIRLLRAGLEKLWRQHQALVKDRKRALQAARAELRKQHPGVKCNVVVREGRPVVEIVRQVLQKKP